MIRKYLPVIFMCVFYLVNGQQNDSLLSILDQELKVRDTYLDLKHRRISELKKEVKKNELGEDKSMLYDTYQKLFDEYRSFKYDSAYFYVEQLKRTASSMKDSSLISASKVKEGFVLISAGLFKEAVDTLTSIEARKLRPKDKYHYYYTLARSFFDLANYNEDQRFRINYIKKGNQNLKEAMATVADKSPEFFAAEGLLKLKQQDWKAAEKVYLYWINHFDLPLHQYGIATSSLSYVYSRMGNTDKSIAYLIQAAISDTQSATKENIALRNLANELYKKGELERANTYVHIALNDASFYNARHRKIEISSILPIIESAQLNKVEQKNSDLQKTVILLAFLALIVLIFIGVIFKQLKEKNKARKALKEYNIRLEELNSNLLEADAIKQDYITYFLRITSELINKIGKIQRSTIHRIKTKRPEDVLNVLMRYSIKKERNELFHQFDLVFIELFPSFIDEFNKLLAKEERRIPKKSELLNTELRIFAMYRLGIQDSQQVADFLNVSISTVYTYKTRIKNKSNCKASFEEKIMEIKRF